MVVEAMVNDILWNPRGDNDCGNARTILFKRKAVFVVASAWACIPRSNSCRWSGMIVKATMLVPGNDEDAVVPDGGVTDGLIRRFDQSLAEPQIIERMLRCAPFVIVQQAVARFDEDVVVGEGSLQIDCEMRILPDVVEVDSLERRDHGKGISCIEPPSQCLWTGTDPIEDVSFRERETNSGLPQGYLRGGWTVIQSA